MQLQAGCRSSRPPSAGRWTVWFLPAAAARSGLPERASLRGFTESSSLVSIRALLATRPSRERRWRRSSSCATGLGLVAGLVLAAPGAFRRPFFDQVLDRRLVDGFAQPDGAGAPRPWVVLVEDPPAFAGNPRAHRPEEEDEEGHEDHGQRDKNHGSHAGESSHGRDAGLRPALVATLSRSYSDDAADRPRSGPSRGGAPCIVEPGGQGEPRPAGGSVDADHDGSAA